MVKDELQSIIFQQQIIRMAASLNMSLLEPSLSSSNTQAYAVATVGLELLWKDEDISRNVLITTYLQITPSLLNVALIHKLSTHFLSLHSFLTHYSFSLLITFLCMLPGFRFHALSFCLSQFFLSISPKCGVITEPSLHVAVYILQLASSSWFNTLILALND